MVKMFNNKLSLYLFLLVALALLVGAGIDLVSNTLIRSTDKYDVYVATDTGTQKEYFTVVPKTREGITPNDLFEAIQPTTTTKPTTTTRPTTDT